MKKIVDCPWCESSIVFKWQLECTWCDMPIEWGVTGGVFGDIAISKGDIVDSIEVVTQYKTPGGAIFDSRDEADEYMEAAAAGENIKKWLESLNDDYIPNGVGVFLRRHRHRISLHDPMAEKQR